MSHKGIHLYMPGPLAKWIEETHSCWFTDYERDKHKGSIPVSMKVVKALYLFRQTLLENREQMQLISKMGDQIRELEAELRYLKRK